MWAWGKRPALGDGIEGVCVPLETTSCIVQIVKDKTR